MSDKFIKNMHHMLESGGLGISLKMLLEDDEKDPFAGAFDSSDEEDKEDKDQDKEEKESDGDEESEEGTEEDEPVEGDDESDDHDVVSSIEDLSADLKTIKQVQDAQQTLKAELVPDPIGTIISKEIGLSNESFARKNSLRRMALLKEESDEATAVIDDLEASLRDEQERIDALGSEYHKLSSKVSKGMEINAGSEAKKAIDLFNNFYNKVNPAELILQSYLNWIIDNADPSKAKEIALQFKEEFNNLLPDNSKIDIQVDNSNYTAAAGAKPTA